MRIHVIGAGSMGSLYGGLLASAGAEVSFVDSWHEHVDALNRDGLHLDGLSGDLRLAVRATTEADAERAADLALILVNTYSTEAAADAAERVLKPSGYALTLQNGVGNVEILSHVLGKERVLAGLSYHSAMTSGPGHVTHTHAGPTFLGEIDRRRTPRLLAIDELFQRAGLQPRIVDDIVAFIWTKLIHNSAINPICAVMGLRVGEIPRTPGADELQTKIIEEAFAVLRAKGVALAEPDPMGAIKAFCRKKFNKPSMLQHIEAGKPTEIDALNGAIVREGRILGVPTPYNESLYWIVKGLEAHRQQQLRGPIDYAALEAEAKSLRILRKAD